MPDLGKSVYTLYTDNAPFDAGLAEAEATASEKTAAIGAKISKVGSGFSKVGKDLTHKLTLPIIGVGAVATDMAMNFQDSMQKLNSLVGVSQKQVNQWSQQFLELGPKVGQSPKALADSMFYITSAGLRGKNALDVLTASAKASAAGLGEQKSIADAATSAMNAYGPKVLSGSAAVDAMTAAVKAGKMDPATLASSLGTIIAPAQAVGVSFQDVVGNMAALSRVGVSAQKGATGIRSVLSTMLKPTKGTAAALKDLGLNTDMVAKSMKDEGMQPALLGIAQRAGLTKDSLKSLSTMVKNGHVEWDKLSTSQTKQVKTLAKVFPNVKALTTVMTLTGKSAGKAAAAIDVVHHSAGATDEAFKSFEKTSKAKMERSMNNLKSLMIELGVKVMPVVVSLLGKLVQVFMGVFNWVSKLSGPWKTIVIAGIAFLAVLGPLVSIIGTMITIIGAVTTAIEILTGAEVAAEAASAGFVAIAVVIVALVAALAIGFYLAYEKVGWFRNAVNTAFRGVKVVIGAVIDFIKKHWHQAWNAVKTAFMFVVGLIKKYWKGLLIVLLGPLGVVIDLIVGYWPQISSAFSKMVGFMKTAWHWVDTNLLPPIQDAVHWMINHVGDIVGPMQSAWGFVMQAVSPIETVLGKIQQAIQWLMDHAGPISSILGKLDSAKNVVSSVISKFAVGTSYAPGGMALVGERGPELVNMPRGAQVWNAQQTRRMINNQGGGSSVGGGGPARLSGVLKIVDLEQGLFEFVDGMITDAQDKHDAFLARRARA